MIRYALTAILLCGPAFAHSPAPPSVMTPPPDFVLSHVNSSLPGLLYALDAAAPVQTTALTAGKPGIQVDATTRDVAAVIEPVSKIQARNGFGKARLVAAGGPGGYPFFRSTPQGFNSGFDALVMPPATAEALFSPPNQSWAVLFVMRQTGNTSSALMKAQAANGTQVVAFTRGAADGALRVEQNDAAATGNEPSSPATALNQWQIVSLISDGATISVYRNHVRTFQTPAASIGGFNAAPASFAFLNNAQADVATILVSVGLPSISQHNAEVARLGARYGIAVGTVTQGSATSVAAKEVDRTTTFETTPNFPASDILPTIPGNVPGNGIKLTAGARQYFTLRMGSAQPGANITTGQQVRQTFYMNYLTGNQQSTFGSPVDTGQPNNNTFAAVARHYRVGDVNDVHLMQPDGLHLRAICSKNRTDCSPGKVWAGMIRLPAVIKPGMTLKVRYKLPAGAHSWFPVWLFRGEQRTPGAGGNPYTGYGTSNSLLRESVSGKNIEVDIDDGFAVAERGTPPGRQLVFGVPDIYGTQFTIRPSVRYRANGLGYRPVTSGGAPYLETPMNRSTGFHDLIFNWRDDGTNLLDVFIGNKLVQTEYMEYPTHNYTDAQGVVRNLGMHLIIGNQAKASFQSGSATALDNDGIPDGWTGVIQEISAWHGNIENPDSYRATP